MQARGPGIGAIAALGGVTLLVLAGIIAGIVVGVAQRGALDLAPGGGGGGGTVVDVIASQNRLAEFTVRLQQFELDEAFAARESLTLFAPTNTAFDALSDEVKALLEADDQLLIDVIAAHAVDGVLRTDQFGAAGVVQTTNGKELALANDGGPTVNGANVIEADLAASNGVVHVVDAVLLPADFGVQRNIMELIAADPRFEGIEEVLRDVRLAETLRGGGPFTLFAPTNDALLALASDESTLAEILLNEQLLKRSLQLHIVSQLLRASDLQDGDVVTTLDNFDVTIARDNRVTLNFFDTTANVVDVDLQASNGVVHAVDAVLLVQELQNLPRCGRFSDVPADEQELESPCRPQTFAGGVCLSENLKCVTPRVLEDNSPFFSRQTAVGLCNAAADEECKMGGTNGGCTCADALVCTRRVTFFELDDILFFECVADSGSGK